MANFDEIDKLVEDNIKLAYFYVQRSTDLDQFYALSAAMDGLLKAAKTYSPDRGISFATYASLKIKWRLNTLRKFLADRKRGSDDISLDAPLADNEEKTLADCIFDNNAPDVVEEVCKTDEINMMLNCLKTLKTQYQQILQLHFGITDCANELSLEKIGSQFGTSKQHIQKLEKKALKILRQKMMESGYEIW